MERIITGITLVNYIKELREVPKLKDNINYFVNVNKTKGGYEINYANLFEPTLLSPFVKEGLLLPFWIFEFIDKVFNKFLSEEEKIFLNKLLEISESLTEIGLTDGLRIRNYQSDSREFYKFKEDTYKEILKYGKAIKKDSLLRKLIVGLLSWKRDKEIMEIYNNIKDRYDVLYRPDWDYFLRAVYVFALSDSEDLEKILGIYYRSEKKKTNFYKDSIPTFAFARMVGFEKHIKDKEVEVNFCRIGVYEELTDINIFFPQKLLRTFELEEGIVSELKKETRGGRVVTKELKKTLLEELDALLYLEGVLGFMGVYIDSYNDFRGFINLPPIKLKYYIISNNAVIYKTTENFEDIIEYVEQNNQKIKRLLRDSGVVRVTVESELLIGLKADKNLFTLSEELNSTSVSVLRKIQGNSNLCKQIYDMLEEEDEMEIFPSDKNSFFYKSKVSDTIIQEFLRIIINKHKPKKIISKEIPYSLLKLATQMLLEGSPYSQAVISLKYDHNFNVKEGYLKGEIELYFGEEVVQEIKDAQNKKKKSRGKF